MNSNYDDSTREDKQMKLRHLMLALMLAAGLSGCASTNVESRHSYDNRTDFSGFNSYAWVPENEAIFSTPASSEHFASTMESMLATKGFTLNSGAPDFLIGTHVVQSYVEVYRTYAGNIDVPKAMVRVNFLNPSSNVVIYESAAFGQLEEDATQETKNAIIDKAVAALLSEFPPGKL
jgi:hypothetical protein